jgi:uncharacterized membrane protein (Fun14 family)
MNNS